MREGMEDNEDKEGREDWKEDREDMDMRAIAREDGLAIRGSMDDYDGNDGNTEQFVGNMGNIGNMGNMGNMGSMVSMGNMGNTEQLVGNMGSMGSMGRARGSMVTVRDEAGQQWQLPWILSRQLRSNPRLRMKAKIRKDKMWNRRLV